jgi:hypothetical protein
MTKSLFQTHILITTVLLSIGLVSSTNGQTPARNDDSIAANVVNKGSVAPVIKTAVPFIKGYNQIAIGEAADQVEDTLGNPKFRDADGYLYDLSDSETLQIRFSDGDLVTTIAAIFTDASKAPTFAEVFGSETVPIPRADGTIYMMVRYPDAGFWVSYFRGGGDKATVALTIQKL